MLVVHKVLSKSNFPSLDTDSVLYLFILIFPPKLLGTRYYRAIKTHMVVVIK